MTGMDSADGRATVRALVPEAELYRYASSIRAMTQGRGHHVRRFAGYEFVPEQEARKLLREREAEPAGV